MTNPAAIRRRITALVSAIVLAVAGAGRSEGETYAMVMSACDREFFETVLGLCEASDILARQGRFLTLTPKGLALREEIRGLA